MTPEVEKLIVETISKGSAFITNHAPALVEEYLQYWFVINAIAAGIGCLLFIIGIIISFMGSNSDDRFHDESFSGISIFLKVAGIILFVIGVSYMCIIRLAPTVYLINKFLNT